MSVKNVMYVKDYIWNPPTCSCKNEKYVASIMDDSAITCDEINEETKAIQRRNKNYRKIFNEKKASCKTQYF